MMKFLKRLFYNEVYEIEALKVEKELLEEEIISLKSRLNILYETKDYDDNISFDFSRSSAVSIERRLLDGAKGTIIGYLNPVSGKITERYLKISEVKHLELIREFEMIKKYKITRNAI